MLTEWGNPRLTIQMLFITTVYGLSYLLSTMLMKKDELSSPVLYKRTIREGTVSCSFAILGR
jgi:hypothetical protein